MAQIIDVKAGQVVRITRKLNGRQYIGHVVRVNDIRKLAVISGLTAVNPEHSGDDMCLLGYTKIITDSAVLDGYESNWFDIEVL